MLLISFIFIVYMHNKKNALINLLDYFHLNFSFDETQKHKHLHCTPSFCEVVVLTRLEPTNSPAAGWLKNCKIYLYV